MAVDRGALRYRIDVEGNFDKLRDFRAGIIAARRSFRNFRRDITGLANDNRTFAASIKETTKAQVDASKQAQKNLSQLRTQARTTRRTTEATKEQTKSVEKQADARKKLSASQKDALNLERQLRTEQRRAGNSQIQKLQRRLSVLRQIIRANQRLRVTQSLDAQNRDVRTAELTADRQKRELIEAQNQLKRAQADLQNKNLVNAQAELKIQQQQLRLAQQRTAQQALAARGRLSTGLTVEETAFRNVEKEIERLNLEKSQRDLRKTSKEFRDLEARAAGLRKELGKAGAANRSFASGLKRTQSTANRVFFTFRRLIGIFAAFQAIRLGVRLFNDLLRGAIQFNAFLETARLGIASLFTAVGDVSTAFGEQVSKQEQLVLAQKEARRQEQLLRRDALRTVATFEQLLNTFQIALAPGVRGGLDVDQIREFAVRISQAAAAIGVAQNQLAEEIRSILAGTIQARTTRIAVALGITNEDIRNAREQGNLFEFLQERFEAFEIAGDEALKTFDGVLNRVRDGIRLLLGSGGLEFFNEVKAALEDVFSTITRETPDGLLEPDPRALAVVEGVADGLRRAVAAARELGTRLDFSSIIAAAQAAGRFIGGAAEGIVEIFGGFIRGLRQISSFFRGVIEQLRPLINVVGELLPEDQQGRSFLSILSQIVTVALGLLGAFKGIALTLGLIIAPLNVVIGLVTGIGALLGGVATAFSIIGTILTASVSVPLLAAVGAVVAIGAVLVQWVDSLTETELRFGTIVRIVRVVLVNAFKFLFSTAKVGFLTLITGLRNGFRTLFQGIREGANFIISTLLKAAGIFSASARERLREVQRRNAEQRDEFVQDLREDAAKIADASRELARITADLVNDTGEEIRDAIADNENAETFEQFVENRKKQFEDILSSFSPSSEGLAEGFGVAEATAEDLVTTIDEIPSILSAGSREVEGFSKRLLDLDKELARTASQLRIAQETSGAADPAGTIRTQLLELQKKIADETLKINQEIETTKVGQIARQRELNELERETVAQGTGARFTLGVFTAEERLALKRQELQVETEIARLVKRIDEARRQGNREELAALEESRAKQEDLLKVVRAGIQANAGELAEIAGGVDADALERFNQIVERTVTLRGLEEDSVRRLTALREQLAELEARTAENGLNTIRAEIEAQRVQSEQRLADLQAELAAERALAETANRFGIQTRERELAIANGQFLVEQQRLANLQATANLTKKTADENIADLEAIIELRRTELQLLIERARLEGGVSDEEFSKAIDRVRQAETSLDETRRAQLTTQKQQTAEIDAQTLRTRELALEAQRVREQLDRPFSFGIESAFAEFETQALDIFTKTKDLATDFFQGLSSTLAGSVLDALDPASNQTFLQNVAQFVRGLAEQALTGLFEILIAKLFGPIFDTVQNTASAAQEQATLQQQTILQTRKEVSIAQEQAIVAQQTVIAGQLSSAGLAFGTSAPQFVTAGATLNTGAATLLSAVPGLQIAANTLLQAAALQVAANSTGGGAPGGVGLWRGGLVTRGVASYAHLSPRAKGYADGGRIAANGPFARPAGLHPSDRIPIWAAKDEFMMRAAAVRAVGADVMTLINDGSIDPNAIRALAGLRAASGRIRKPRTPGFAGGGLLTDRVRTGNRLAAQQLEATAAGGGPVRAYIVADEEEAEAFLRGGGDAFRRFNSTENDSAIEFSRR